MKQLQLVTLASLIALITLLLYASGVYYDYVQWDEGSYIVQNPHIRSFSLDNIYWMLTATHAAMWAPVLWLSYAIDYQFSGVEPFAYHLSNILLHSANSLWIFFLTVLLLKIKPIALFSIKQVYLAAFIAAVLFAIHPQHVEPVMWIASRKDVLSLFFILATFWFYLHYSQNRSNINYLLSLFCFVLAIATKPVAMTVPAILVVLDLYLLQRINSIKTLVRYALLEKLAFWGLALFSGAMAVYAHLQQARIATISDIGLIERLLNAAAMIMFYLGKFVLPLGLSPYYPFPETLNFYPLILLVLLTTLLYVLLLKYKQSILWMAWLIFLIALFPMLNILTFNEDIAGADRFVYFPMLGFYILIGIGLLRVCLYCSNTAQFLTKISVFLVAIALIIISQQQISIWQNNLHLWNAANRAYPHHFEIQDSLAHAYFQQHNYPAAIHYFQQNAAQNENCIRCYHGLSKSYLQLGELQKALHFLEKIVHYAAQQTEPLAGLDDVYFKIALAKGRLGDLHGALQAAEQGVALNPNNQAGQRLKQQLQAYQNKTQN